MIRFEQYFMDLMDTSPGARKVAITTTNGVVIKAPPDQIKFQGDGANLVVPSAAVVPLKAIVSAANSVDQFTKEGWHRHLFEQTKGRKDTDYLTTKSINFEGQVKRLSIRVGEFRRFLKDPELLFLEVEV